MLMKPITSAWKALSFTAHPVRVVQGVIDLIYFNNFLWDRALDKLVISFSSIPLDFCSINYLKHGIDKKNQDDEFASGKTVGLQTPS